MITCLGDEFLSFHFGQQCGSSRGLTEALSPDAAVATTSLKTPIQREGKNAYRLFAVLVTASFPQNRHCSRSAASARHVSPSMRTNVSAHLVVGWPLLTLTCSSTAASTIFVVRLAGLRLSWWPVHAHFLFMASSSHFVPAPPSQLFLPALS